MPQVNLYWLLAASLGALTGGGELVSRYRDDPWRAVRTFPALLYLFVNMGASLLAWVLVHAFGWTFGLLALNNSIAPDLLQALIAGFGAMALLRSALLTVRFGDQDVGIGLVAFLQSMLDAADRAVDRRRGQDRSATVCRLMKYVSFQKAQIELPTYCLALMQNLAPEDQEKFGRQITALGTASMGDEAKALAHGLAIMNVMGQDVLESGVNALTDHIRA